MYSSITYAQNFDQYDLFQNYNVSKIIYSHTQNVYKHTHTIITTGNFFNSLKYRI